MTTTHTPGPWTVTRHDDLPIGNIHHGPHQPGEVSVCVVSLRGNGTDEANARLLVAAPDLLVALKAAREHVDWSSAIVYDSDGLSLADVINVAIAKTEEG